MKILFKTCFCFSVIILILFTGCLKDSKQSGNTIEKTEHTQKPVIVKHVNITSEATEPVKVTNIYKEDLNCDGITDNIEFTVDIINEPVLDAELKVNDAKIDLRLECPSTDIHIIDINPSDQYKEIDVFEYGPVEPKSIFYIYDGLFHIFWKWVMYNF